MPEYQLYCFAQSGNAYRCALHAQLIGADWEPIWVDFCRQGHPTHAGLPVERQRDGRGAVLVHKGRSSASPA